MTTGRLKRLVLTMTATVAIAGIVSAPASALQWLVGGKGLTAPVFIKASGTLAYADLSSGTTIICEGTSEGTVGPGARDLISSIEQSRCKFVTGLQGSCESEENTVPTMVQLNLPYLSLLLTKGSLTLDRITAEKGSGPGWALKCGVGGILKVTDECGAGYTNTLVVNEAAGVVTPFNEVEPYSCTFGNSTSGMISGRPLEKNPAAGTLSISHSPNT